MYVEAFVILHLFLQTFTLYESSRIGEIGAVKYYEEMWRTDSESERRKSLRQPKSPRRKREFIDPSMFHKDWIPDQFHGVRSETIIRVYNKGIYPEFIHRENSFGVRIQSKLVLTLCSAVTYLNNPAERVTPWVHNSNRFPLFKSKPEDITVSVINIDSSQIPVSKILIHPGCNSWYDLDVAVIVTAQELKFGKNVWIHTAENMVFRRNLDRVVAAQAVLGKCTVPMYKRTTKTDISFAIDYAKIHFQHWDGCKSNVCPYWDEEDQQVLHDPNRCANLLNGTRYCAGWTLPQPLCGLLPGTPVFCDVGHIHGLMGFIATETYLCSEFDTSAVMVGLVDSIGWIRDTLMIQYSSAYKKNMPQWMINLRENYTSNVVPRLRPLKTTTPGPAIRFDHFIGHQSLSMVNVYIESKFKCRGTLVTHFIAIVPCSCITISNVDMNTEENIKAATAVEHVDVNKIQVSLMVNGSIPITGVTNLLVDEECNSHYEEDYALVLLTTILPGSKLAWVMTAHHVLFRNMLRILPVADASMGYDCYWMENRFPKNSYFVKHKIRFVHWTQCSHNVCPNEFWRQNQKGLVGIITKAMDLNPEPCPQREPAQQTAVFMGLDQFLPQFYTHIWMYEMEVMVRDNAGQARGSSSAIAPSLLLTFLALRLILSVSKK